MSWRGQIDGPFDVPIYGVPDEDGVPTIIGSEPGYHLNIAPALMDEALSPFIVSPTQPARVWAGDTSPWPLTIFLRFADEAEARASSLGINWVDDIA